MSVKSLLILTCILSLPISSGCGKKVFSLKDKEQKERSESDAKAGDTSGADVDDASGVTPDSAPEAHSTSEGKADESSDSPAGEEDKSSSGSDIKTWKLEALNENTFEFDENDRNNIAGVTRDPCVNHNTKETRFYARINGHRLELIVSDTTPTNVDLIVRPLTTTGPPSPTIVSLSFLSPSTLEEVALDSATITLHSYAGKAGELGKASIKLEVSNRTPGEISGKTLHIKIEDVYPTDEEIGQCG